MKILSTSLGKLQRSAGGTLEETVKRQGLRLSIKLHTRLNERHCTIRRRLTEAFMVSDTIVTLYLQHSRCFSCIIIAIRILQQPHVKTGHDPADVMFEQQT